MKTMIDKIKKLKVNESVTIPWNDPALEGQRPQGPGQIGIVGGANFDCVPKENGLEVTRTK